MKKLFLSLTMFCLLALQMQAAKYYLYAGAPNPWSSPGDGTVVQVPDGTIHTVLNALVAADEAWIASGTYATTNTPATIALQEGVKVYGGFYGNETSLSQRQLQDEVGGNGVAEPWEFKYPTIITGTGTAGSLATYVMFTSATNYTLDGLTIQDHYVMARYGGAIYNSSGSTTMSGLTINKCTIRNINKSHDGTGGVTGGGSAIYVAGNATLSSCLVENNVLTYTVTGKNSSYGGSICAAKGVSITGCIIRNNNCNGNTTYPCVGGGIVLGGATDTYTALVANNVIYNNTAASGGGIYIGGSTSTSTIVNNTIVNNLSLSTGNSSYSGGIAGIPANAKIYNNVLFYNQYAIYSAPTTYTIRNLGSLVTVDIQNSAYNGGGVGTGSNYTGVNNNATLSSPGFIYSPTTIGYTATMPSDVKAANFALRQTATALINLGGAFTGITPATDILGTARPYGSANEIGAYEYSGAIFRTYLYAGSDPWGIRVNGPKIAVTAGTIHTVLNTLSSGDEVWIAAGTYATTTTPATIALKDGVKIYGGFKGSENALTDRELADETAGNGVIEPWEFKNPTIITGSATQQTYGMFESATTYTLDGLTIQNHTLNAAKGGAIYNSSATSTPTINKCTIRNISKSYDVASSTGGGTAIYVAGNAIISSCLVENNTMNATVSMNSSYGGTITSAKGINITGCVIRNNDLIGSAGFPVVGGGIALGSSVDSYVGLIANNVIYNNSATNGGGIHICTSGTSGTGYTCGTIYTIVNNTIVNNHISGTGSTNSGGISNVLNAKVYNNVLYNNTKAGTPNSIVNLSSSASASSDAAATTLYYDLQNCAFNGGGATTGNFTGVSNISALVLPNFVSAPVTIGYTAGMPGDVKAANFALTSGSELINTGGSFTGITPSIDILGNLRPFQSTGSDIGAYESSFTTRLSALNNIENNWVNISVQGKTILCSETGTIQIYTLQGSEIWRSVGQRAEIKLSNGLYVIRFSNGKGQSLSKKVVLN